MKSVDPKTIEIEETIKKLHREVPFLGAIAESNFTQQELETIHAAFRETFNKKPLQDLKLGRDK